MDIERSLKRLAVIVLLALIVILVSKSLLTKTAKNLNAEAGKQQQIKASQTPVIVPESAVAEVAEDVVENADAPAVTAESSPTAAGTGAEEPQ